MECASIVAWASGNTVQSAGTQRSDRYEMYTHGIMFVSHRRTPGNDQRACVSSFCEYSRQVSSFVYIPRSQGKVPSLYEYNHSCLLSFSFDISRPLLL